MSVCKIRPLISSRPDRPAAACLSDPSNPGNAAVAVLAPSNRKGLSASTSKDVASAAGCRVWRRRGNGGPDGHCRSRHLVVRGGGVVVRVVRSGKEELDGVLKCRGKELVRCGWNCRQNKVNGREGW